MTMDDFMRTMLTAWPNAIVDEDPYTGELIVRTGVIEHKGKVQSLEAQESF
jgi:hypothetical protein